KRVQISDDLSWQLPPVAVAAGHDTVTVGVRPEHLTVTDDGSGVPMAVELVENLGADTLVYGQLAGQSMIVRTAGSVVIKAGDRLSVKPQATDSLHLFDADSGRRLASDAA